MREKWVRDAIHGEKSRGYMGKNYMYFSMPKALGVTQPESQWKVALCEVVAQTINLGRGKPSASSQTRPFKQIPMTVYPRLVENLNKDARIGALVTEGNIVVQIKGSAAYQYIAPNDRDILPGGDVDIAVYINPHTCCKTFESINTIVKTIIMQTLSQYKRCLDHMFCIENSTDKVIRDVFLDAFQVEDFKQELSAYLRSTPFDFKSPFDDTSTRNKVSRQSFIIADSMAHPTDVMHIDIPHFEKCEHIPLRRSPFVCSHNRSIIFDRCSNDDTTTPVFGDLAPQNGRGSFDLFRMKLNFMRTRSDIDHISVTPQRDHETVGAEFIDISVPRQDDAELHDFYDPHDPWGPRTEMHWDEDMQCDVRVPTLDSAISDLFRMLYVYTCPESKREKRLNRYHDLLAIRDNALKS
jgi:hypothetical protein